MKKVLGIAAALAASLSFVPAASADERTCRGSLGAITVDNLRVPEGATCTLNGTSIKGTLKVEKGATLVASGIRLVGNVQAENAKSVTVKAGSRIGGSVQVKQGGGASVLDSTISGDIQYDENRSRAVGAAQPGRRLDPGRQEHGRRDDHVQPRRRQPAVQGEPPGAEGLRQRRAGQQGRPVRAAVSALKRDRGSGAKALLLRCFASSRPATGRAFSRPGLHRKD